jgi:predicted  nucleic acid-binding Zn-ribbon protein
LLNLMDDIEVSTQKVAALGEELSAANTIVTDVEANFARETSRLEKQLEETRKQREIVATQLDEVSLGKYNEYAKRGGGVAVAHPDKGNCSACGMALTPFNLREAKSQQWPTCESCGRLLFIE